MTEEWREIKGFEGRYEASSYGRIRNLVRGKKLSHKDIPEIRRLREIGLTHEKIADQFHVSKHNIALIFKDGNWAGDPKFRILKGTRNSDGYIYVCLRFEGKNHRESIHRLVAKTFISAIPKGMCVNHLDGNPSNNSVENLEITTYSGNTRHAIDVLGWKPTVQSGAKNGCALLTEDQVRYIKSHQKKYGVATKLAKEFGVTGSAIGLILSGKNWAHIK